MKNLEQKQGIRSKSRVLRMPPAHNVTEGVGKPPKLALQPDPPGHTPTLTVHKEQARRFHPAQLVSQQGILLFVLPPLCCSRGPNKALPEFLVWPLINFY